MKKCQHHLVQRPADATRTTAELPRSALSHRYASEDRSQVHVQELQPAISNQPGNSQGPQSVLPACMDRTQNLFLNEEIVLVFCVLSAFSPSFLLLNCPPMSPRRIHLFYIQLLTETVIFSSLRELPQVLSQQEDEEHIGSKHLTFQVDVPEQRHTQTFRLLGDPPGHASSSCLCWLEDHGVILPDVSSLQETLSCGPG